MPPFAFPSSTPSWFLGHMAKSLRELPALLKDIDLVIEARDARLPLTSINGAFDIALSRAWGGSSRSLSSAGHGMGIGVGGPSGWIDPKGKAKEKVVVYTKRDLAEDCYEAPLISAFRDHAGERVFFVDTTKDADVRSVLRYVTDKAARDKETMPEGMKVLVVGMPNVGKSSLLNGLRRVGMHKGKAFRTGSTPGLTRKLTGTVKINDEPSIYVYDTPGVMVPYLGKGEAGAERGLKLALTAGIKEGLFPEDVVAEYLLYRMNERGASAAGDAGATGAADQGGENYAKHWTSLLPLPPDFVRTDTMSLAELLDALADRLGTLRKGGERDTDSARNWLIRAWREGRLGRWTLDDLEPRLDALHMPSGEGEQEYPLGLSDTQDPPAPADPLNLDQRVSLAVRTFLATSARGHGDEIDKRDLSLSQSRKRDAKKADEERRQRLVARGVNPEQRGPADWRVRRGEDGRFRRTLRRTRARGSK